MSTVCGVVARRFLNAGSFADLAPNATAVSITREGITFDRDLTPEETAAVWWRMTSRDDADETARRALWATRNAPETCPCCVQTIDYLLGEVPA